MSAVPTTRAQETADAQLNDRADVEMLRRIKDNPFAKKDYLNRLNHEIEPRTGDSASFFGDQTANGVDPTLNLLLEDGYTRVEKVAVQPDGKILVGGYFPLVNGVRRNNLIRLNADGTTDTTFNSGNSGPNGGVLDIAVLPDGKILIAGDFSSYNGSARSRIARLNADGSLDAAFDPGGGAGGTIFDISVLPDGKILVAGVFTTFNGANSSRIVRLNANGTLDGSFAAPAMNNAIRELALQTDGRIVIVGQFSQVGALTRSGAARLNPDGTHDTTFDPLTNTMNTAYSVAIQTDGKILVGSAYSGTGPSAIVRLNPTGTLDGTFTSAYPAGFESTLHTMILQPDGKILAGGYFNNAAGGAYGVVRFNTNGSIDPSFALSSSTANFLEVFSIAATPGGQIVAGGDFYKLGTSSTVSKHVALINGNGSLDNSFTALIEGFGTVNSTLRQTDGKILVGGDFKRVNGSSRQYLIRLNADGTLDAAFNPLFDSEIYALALQPDGKILVGGSFTTVNGFETGPAVRLNPDGSIDGTFVLPFDVEATFIFSILVQPDGKILGGGFITNPRAPLGSTGLYRVNSNGSEDGGFSMASYTGVIRSISRIADGRLYIGGSFTNYAGSGANRIARLNANGTFDNTFAVGTGANNIVYKVTAQADGKVLVGGFYNLINGQYGRGIARLNADGSLDANFNPGLGLDGGAYDVILQADNKILVGGSFATFNGSARTNLARLNPDGTLDNTLTDQTNGFIKDLELQPDGKLLVGGGFTAVNGVSRTALVRLSETDLTPPANDNFANATSIVGLSGSTNTRSVNASAEAGEPSHAGVAAARSIWFKWRAPADGLFSFTTAGASFDTTVGVYTGSAVSALVETASNDDAAFFDPTSRVIVRAAANTDYYIAVDGKNGQSGIVNLAWKQAARTYRFYAQTGNGNISPRVPVITATRTGDGAQFVAQNISAGVFELDLPVDNATYTVTIAGSDQWSPNTFTLDNTSFTARSGKDGAVEAMTPAAAGGILVTTAVTIAATVSGELAGVTNPNGVTVFLGSEGGPNPIAPRPCAITSGQTGNIVYNCQFLVDTRHQIKPSLSNVVFTPSNRAYPQPLGSNPLPGPGTRFTMANQPTYNIRGAVSANGVNLAGAVVKLSGRKTHSYITSADGNFQFDSLPAGGPYVIEAALAGYTFLPQTIEDLQGNVTLAVVAAGSCQYTLSAAGSSAGAGGGAGSFRVNTANGCPWTVVNDASWMTMNISSGNGSGSVYFTVQANGGAPRSGTISVGGQNYRVTQAGGCSFSLSAESQNFPASGGTGSVAVTTSNGCSWTPTPSDYCMITVSGGSGGSGSFSFTVGANTGVARTATVTVGASVFTINQAAAPGVHRTRFDFDGDGRADVAVFRPSTGVWYAQGSSQGSIIRQFGASGDVPQTGDYDGDGRADLALFRPNGAGGAEWWIDRSGGGNVIATRFGEASDRPVAADYTGDGKTDIAIWRPSTGEWFVLRSEDYSYFALPFGLATDIPAPGDYDGDGRTDFAVFRQSTGTWYILNPVTGQVEIIQFGLSGDKPVVADYDGDGRADIALYRTSNNTWYRLDSAQNRVFRFYQFGASGDVPAVADYNGDKRADIAVYRPSTGTWMIWSCTTNTLFGGQRWGLETDLPVQSSGLP